MYAVAAPKIINYSNPHDKHDIGNDLEEQGWLHYCDMQIQAKC